MAWRHDTDYRGVRMRSQGEAAWAAFFDERGIAWEYEPVKFHKRYLPDFGLAGRTVFVEIKSRAFMRLNCFHFCHDPLVVMFGRPDDVHARAYYQRPGDLGILRCASWDEAYSRALANERSDKPCSFCVTEAFIAEEKRRPWRKGSFANRL